MGDCRRNDADVSSNANRNPNAAEPAIPQSYSEGEAIADFTISCGNPGKPGYTDTRPFDYFQFQFTAASSDAPENVLSHALLVGTDYPAGKNLRGVWGLYGGYDYIAPQIFRVATTAAEVGTTLQWWLSDHVALQGTALAGVGYGSGGSIRGGGDRDYHIGVSPQALMASRLIMGDRAVIDLDLRDYYLRDVTSTGGSENISRGVVGITLRVHKLHGITLRYTFSRRDARYRERMNTVQSVGALSLGYTYLGQEHFGTVDWRKLESAVTR